MQQEEIERRHSYHKPTEATQEVHADWRVHMRWLAERINELPDGLGGHTDTREKALAQTALEECSFWIHAHIARNMQ